MPSYLLVPITVMLNAVLLLACLLGYFKIINLGRESKKILIGSAFTFNLFSLLVFFSMSSKFEAEIKRWFFPGHIKVESVFVEGDGEVVDHYEDVHKFVPNGQIATNSEAGIDFLTLFLFVGGIELNWFFWASNIGNEGQEEDKTDEKLATFYIIVRLVLATGLMLCLLNMPEGYYYFIRWLLFIGCIYLFGNSFKHDQFFSYLFILTLFVLFNPIYQIHFTRLLWNIIDVIAAFLLIIQSAKKYIDSRY